MLKLSSIPVTLVGLRFLIALLLCLDALDYRISEWFVPSYVIAVISDIFDGIIARRLGVSTAQLRQADSWADICLYLVIAISAWNAFQEGDFLQLIFASIFLIVLSISPLWFNHLRR